MFFFVKIEIQPGRAARRRVVLEVLERLEALEARVAAEGVDNSNVKSDDGGVVEGALAPNARVDVFQQFNLPPRSVHFLRFF